MVEFSEGELIQAAVIRSVSNLKITSPDVECHRMTPLTLKAMLSNSSVEGVLAAKDILSASTDFNKHC
jgi:hypothetical protein